MTCLLEDDRNNLKPSAVQIPVQIASAHASSDPIGIALDPFHSTGGSSDGSTYVSLRNMNRACRNHTCRSANFFQFTNTDLVQSPKYAKGYYDSEGCD